MNFSNTSMSCQETYLKCFIWIYWTAQLSVTSILKLKFKLRRVSFVSWNQIVSDKILYEERNRQACEDDYAHNVRMPGLHTSCKPSDSSWRLLDR